MASILDVIEEEARRQAFSRVPRVILEVGRLCNVEVEALAFCFDVMTRGSCAEAATLEVTMSPGEGRCRRCERTSEVTSWSDACPSCETWDLTITGGDQLLINALEVE